MMHDSKGVARLFAAPFAIWAAIFIVLPLFFVFYHGLTDGQGAFTLANLWEAVQLEYLQALGLSVELALISTLICLVLAYPLCMILQQIKRGRMLLIFLLFLLPLWMNSLLTTMAWQTILEKNGIINSILHAFLAGGHADQHAAGHRHRHGLQLPRRTWCCRSTSRSRTSTRASSRRRTTSARATGRPSAASSSRFLCPASAAARMVFIRADDLRHQRS